MGGLCAKAVYPRYIIYAGDDNIVIRSTFPSSSRELRKATDFVRSVAPKITIFVTRGLVYDCMCNRTIANNDYNIATHSLLSLLEPSFTLVKVQEMYLNFFNRRAVMKMYRNLI